MITPSTSPLLHLLAPSSSPCCPCRSFTPFYAMPEDNPALKQDLPVAPEGLPEMKPEDMQYFGKLLQEVDEAELSVEEVGVAKSVR